MELVPPANDKAPAGAIERVLSSLSSWALVERAGQESAGRLREIDSLRGVAALAVVVFHYTFYYDKLYGHSSQMPWRFTAGTHGVKLFFVISGFVILATLRRCQGPRDFLRARFLRLYPAFWVSLVPSSFATALELPERVVRPWEFVANLTMVPRFFGARTVDGVYWTLAVELVFYSCMLALYLVGQLSLSRVPWTLALWLIVSLCFTMLPGYSEDGSLPGLIATALVLKHIGSFAIGMVLFEVHRTRQLREWHVGVSGLSAASVYVWQGRGHLAFYVIASATVFCALFFRPRVLRTPVLVFSGAISYAVYLLHQNIGFAMIHAGYRYAVHPAVSMSASLVVVGLLAWGVHEAVEKPAIAWAQRLKQTARTVPGA